MLSCVCDFEPEYYFHLDEDFSPLQTKRRRRCTSCKTMIELGEECMKVIRWAPVIDQLGDDTGKEKHMADKYMCEKCAGLFLRFQELGYCVAYDWDMRETLQEYQDQVAHQKWFRRSNDEEMADD